MTTSKEKVLELVATGKISAAEGDELLRALEPSQKSPWHAVAHPFESLSLGATLVLSVCGCLAALGLSRLNLRFDGALDVRTTSSAVSLGQALLDQLVAWPLTALVFWAGALLASRRPRPIDLLAVVGVARLPLLIGGVAGVLIGPHLPRDFGAAPEFSSVALVLLLLALVLPALGLAIALMSQGFRHVSGLRGGKATAVFVASLVVAELLAKAVLHVLSPLLGVAS